MNYFDQPAAHRSIDLPGNRPAESPIPRRPLLSGRTRCSGTPSLPMPSNAEGVESSDWAGLADTPIPGEPEVKHGRERDLDQHLQRLRRELRGSTELVYAHAATIVAIRREFDLTAALCRFRSMWCEAGDLLSRQLSLRWLTSAADTLADHGRTGEERSTAMLAVAIAGLVKIHETERFAAGEPDPLFDRLEALHAAPVPLLDGLTGFAIGSGDMVANLVKRLDRVAGGGTIAHLILQETVNRVLRGPSAFSRLRELHSRDATRWRDGA